MVCRSRRRANCGSKTAATPAPLDTPHAAHRRRLRRQMEGQAVSVRAGNTGVIHPPLDRPDRETVESVLQLICMYPVPAMSRSKSLWSSSRRLALVRVQSLPAPGRQAGDRGSQHLSAGQSDQADDGRLGRGRHAPAGKRLGASFPAHRRSDGDVGAGPICCWSSAGEWTPGRGSRWPVCRIGQQ